MFTCRVAAALVALALLGGCVSMPPITGPVSEYNGTVTLTNKVVKSFSRYDCPTASTRAKLTVGSTQVWYQDLQTGSMGSGPLAPDGTFTFETRNAYGVGEGRGSIHGDNVTADIVGHGAALDCYARFQGTRAQSAQR